MRDAGNHAWTRVGASGCGAMLCDARRMLAWSKKVRRSADIWEESARAQHRWPARRVSGEAVAVEDRSVDHRFEIEQWGQKLSRQQERRSLMRKSPSPAQGMPHPRLLFEDLWLRDFVCVACRAWAWPQLRAAYCHLPEVAAEQGACEAAQTQLVPNHAYRRPAGERGWNQRG